MEAGMGTLVVCMVLAVGLLMYKKVPSTGIGEMDQKYRVSTTFSSKQEQTLQKESTLSLLQEQCVDKKCLDKKSGTIAFFIFLRRQSTMNSRLKLLKDIYSSMFQFFISSFPLVSSPGRKYAKPLQLRYIINNN